MKDNISKIIDSIIIWLVTDYLKPASSGSVDTYCYDIDIRKFLLFLNR